MPSNATGTPLTPGEYRDTLASAARSIFGNDRAGAKERLLALKPEQFRPEVIIDVMMDAMRVQHRLTLAAEVARAEVEGAPKLELAERDYAAGMAAHAAGIPREPLPIEYQGEDHSLSALAWQDGWDFAASQADRGTRTK
jgi:hypothetical protein